MENTSKGKPVTESKTKAKAKAKAKGKSAPLKNKSRPMTKVDEIIHNLLRGAKVRAKQKGIMFNLDVCDLVLPSFCPVLGIPLKPGVGKTHDNSPTIDRINPAGGYTRYNVAIISMRANRIKSNATLKELRQVYDWYAARMR